jgi:hypothetical protein
MKMTRLAMASIAILFGTAAAPADDYPSHPITMLEGFPPNSNISTQHHNALKKIFV